MIFVRCRQAQRSVRRRFIFPGVVMAKLCRCVWRSPGMAAGVAAVGAVWPAMVSAQEAAAAAAIDSGSTAWMLTATALVLMMTIPGLALFYGGMVRKKNVLSVTMQSFTMAAMVSVLWAIVGYSLSFSEGSAFVGGLSKAMLAGIGTDAVTGVIPETVFVMFQMTFAIITPALITGAFAERMKFSAMLAFLAAWVLLVYAPVAHWVWGGGFLMGDGVLDYAGGTVVHINAGVAGLVAAVVLGPRKGYGTDNMAPHNLTLSVTGAALLWVGWFGFNAGSAAAADGRAGMAMLATQLAAAAAALSWMLAEWLIRRKPSVLGAISGAVGGLVAITPASGFVLPGGALAIGLIAGVACFWGATGLKHMLRYDDSLDCFGVHGVGGIVGALLTGVFAAQAVGGSPGLLEGHAWQVVTQAYGVAVTIAYGGVVTWGLLRVVDRLIGLRVSSDEEREGLDITQHGEVVH